MTSWGQIERQVKERAGDRCEYCQMHQSLQGATFHVEHILPRSQAGPSTLENLACACPGCNLHKADRVEAPDPQTGDIVPLFNPRTDNWSDHFQWDGYKISALTPIGRTTISALDLNHPRRLRIRKPKSASVSFR
jgi:5-methylcytosine-specific restriction endonuclease McrA